MQFLREHFDITKCYAATLTMKQFVFETGSSEHYGSISLTDDLARQNLRHFLNQLNAKIYRRQRYKGKRVKVASVLEANETTNRHYHLIIQKPEAINDPQFTALINLLWFQTDWGDVITDIQPCRDDGWISYITKLKTKVEYDLCID